MVEIIAIARHDPTTTTRVSPSAFVFAAAAPVDDDETAQRQQHTPTNHREMNQSTTTTTHQLMHNADETSTTADGIRRRRRRRCCFAVDESTKTTTTCLHCRNVVCANGNTQPATTIKPHQNDPQHQTPPRQKHAALYHNPSSLTPSNNTDLFAASAFNTAKHRAKRSRFNVDNDKPCPHPRSLHPPMRDRKQRKRPYDDKTGVGSHLLSNTPLPQPFVADDDDFSSANCRRFALRAQKIAPFFCSLLLLCGILLVGASRVAAESRAREANRHQIAGGAQNHPILGLTPTSPFSSSSASFASEFARQQQRDDDTLDTSPPSLHQRRNRRQQQQQKYYTNGVGDACTDEGSVCSTNNAHICRNNTCVSACAMRGLKECRCSSEEDNYCFLCCGSESERCAPAHEHRILRTNGERWERESCARCRMNGAELEGLACDDNDPQRLCLAGKCSRSVCSNKQQGEYCDRRLEKICVDDVCENPCARVAPHLMVCECPAIDPDTGFASEDRCQLCCYDFNVKPSSRRCQNAYRKFHIESTQNRPIWRVGLECAHGKTCNRYGVCTNDAQTALPGVQGTKQRISVLLICAIVFVFLVAAMVTRHETF